MRKFVALLLSIILLFSFTPAAYADVINMDIPYQQKDPSLYFVEIDLTNQVGTVYERDAAGEYTTIVRQFLVTSGDQENQTPTGTFKLGTMRERFGYFLNFNIYAQYWTQVVRGIYLHSVLYSKRNTNSMNRSSYNNLGKNVSHGCVRMLVEDARFIYYNCPPGTVCRLVKKTKNSALTASLKSKVPWNKYKPDPDPLPEVLPIPAIILNDNVPLRTGFSLGAHEKDRTLATLSAGTKIEVLQAGPEWVKAKVGKREGYIQTKHVRAIAPETQSVTQTPKPEVQSAKEQIVSVEQAYIYSEMFTSSPIHAALAIGTQVTVLDDSPKLWLKVRFNAIEGYMLKTDVSIAVVNIPADATPQSPITPEPTPAPTPEPTPVPTPTPFLKPLF